MINVNNVADIARCMRCNDDRMCDIFKMILYEAIGGKLSIELSKDILTITDLHRLASRGFGYVERKDSYLIRWGTKASKAHKEKSMFDKKEYINITTKPIFKIKPTK